MKLPTDFSICYPAEFNKSRFDGCVNVKIQYEKRVQRIDVPEEFGFYMQILEQEHRAGVLRNMWYTKVRQGH